MDERLEAELGEQPADRQHDEQVGVFQRAGKAAQYDEAEQGDDE
jgi:hypothetical protein